MSTTLRARLHALRLKRGDRPNILVRPPPRRPERVLAARGAIVASLLLVVMLVFWLDRDGLRDNMDGDISAVDVVYFTVVTVTTVGYGDVVPVSPRARLIDAFLVTPIRLFVWFLFIGTAYEFLIQRSVEDFRMLRLQKNLANHVIICGYGGIGQFVAAELVRQGRSAADIVVIDKDKHAADSAAAQGFTTLHGSATREEILEVAGAPRAAALVVCVNSDETTSLVVLTAREISTAKIVAKIDAEENRKLMRRSGADQIMTLAALGGSLMANGVAGDLGPAFVSDLVSREGRVHLTQRKPRPEEIGRSAYSIDRLVMVRRGSEPAVCGRSLHEFTVAADDDILCIGFT